MQLELKKPWHGRRVGSVVDVPDGAANLLIRRQVAVPFGEPPQPEKAVKPKASKRTKQ